MTITFTGAANRKMAARDFARPDVEAIVMSGRVIREYPDDRPFPSRLVLGWIGDRPVHVVYAVNEADDERIVISVYEPDPTQWTADFTTRIDR